MTAQGGVRQDFLHIRAYTIMHTLTYTSDFNFVTPCDNIFFIRRKVQLCTFSTFKVSTLKSCLKFFNSFAF